MSATPAPARGKAFPPRFYDNAATSNLRSSDFQSADTIIPHKDGSRLEGDRLELCDQDEDGWTSNIWRRSSHVLAHGVEGAIEKEGEILGNEPQFLVFLA